MTPDRFRSCLALLHWSQRGLAALLRVDERQVRRWAAGAAIPERIAAWLERLAACHASNPPPAANAGENAGSAAPARVDVVMDLMAEALASSWGIPKSEVAGRMRCRYCGAPTVLDQDGMPEPHCYYERAGRRLRRSRTRYRVARVIA